MAQYTQKAIIQTFTEMLRKMPFDKITVSAIVANCEISSNTFYYHFQDIYDLVEWVCVEDGKKALQDKKTYDTWQEGMSQIFDAVLDNKEFILNVCRSIGRERVERYLYKFTYDMIREVVEGKCRGKGLTEKQKDFMTDFYKYAFVGVILDWIDHGMKEDYEEIVENMSIMLHGNIVHSIGNFEKTEEQET